MADFVEYTIDLGTFEGEKFVWKTVKKFDTFEPAYKFYKDYVDKQMKYTDEELRKIWSSGRLDIELKKGNKLLNWVGIYSRKVDKESDDEEDETTTPKKEE